MLQAEKAEQLLAFLATLPEPLALRLARAVETDRLAGGRALPHDLVLEGLRPTLRRANGCVRVPTPKRLFCKPFEDLLTSSSRKEKQKGTIARSSIELVWDWVSQSLIPERCSQYETCVRQALLANQPLDAEAHASAFWAAAGEAIILALSSEADSKAARVLLGTDAVVGDAREMALLLISGTEFSELQRVVPRSLPSLSEEVLWELRDVYDRLIAIRPDAAPYAAVVAMRRLERRWEALRLPLLVARQSQDTLISSTDMGLVGELLLNELDEHAMVIRAAKPQQFDTDELLKHLGEFAALSNGIVKEIEMRRDGRWGQRLMKDRMAVAELMDALMNRGPREILAAIPTLKSGAYAGGPRVPDLSKAFDFAKGAKAVDYARLIAGCKPLAAAAAFGASQAAALGEVSVALKSYSEDIVRELRTSEEERRERAEQFFGLAVELTRILFSSEEAEFLRRRGRAAVSAQAAA